MSESSGRYSELKFLAVLLLTLCNYFPCPACTIYSGRSCAIHANDSAQAMTLMAVRPVCNAYA